MRLIVLADTDSLTGALDAAGIAWQTVDPDRGRVMAVLAGTPTARQLANFRLRGVFSVGEPAHDVLDTAPAASVIATADFYRQVLAADGSGLPTGFRRVGNVWLHDIPVPPDESFEFDVVISFAGPDREVAREISDIVTAAGYRVFYDYDRQHDLLGQDLAEYLQDVYFRRGRYAVVVVSRAFLASTWASNWEWRAVMARMRSQRGPYVLPYFLDDTVVPGLNDTLGYATGAQHTPREFAQLVIRKLRTPSSGVDDHG